MRAPKTPYERVDGMEAMQAVLRKYAAHPAIAREARIALTRKRPKPDSLKAKLKVIEDVKRYAIEDLGLKGEKNYTTYYDQQGKDLMWWYLPVNLLR